MNICKRSKKKSNFKQILIYQKIFDEACKDLFGDKVYHTWCELIFHLILTFVSIWHDGMNNVEQNFEEATQGLMKKLKKPMSDSVFFLYRDLFTKKISP